jgi:very-short-patch-repair endonuclease
LRKTTILESLGWRVFRIKHGKEVCQTHLAAILAEF